MQKLKLTEVRNTLNFEIQRGSTSHYLYKLADGAYNITIDYDVERTTTGGDKAGEAAAGSPDRITAVEDIWTFTRDTRSSDPNWILIETRATEKPGS